MILLYNAKIHTLNDAQPAATALAIDAGRVVFVGDDYTVLERFGGRGRPGSEPTLLDMGGRAILPGLTDAHLHLEQYALGLQKVDCETTTKEECLRRVAERAAHLPPGDWVLGHGWNQNNWAGGFGTAAELDAAAPDHPVYLTAKSLHAGWANRAALRLAGITAATPDPDGGRIGRPEGGEPDGILFESAMNLIYAGLPEPTLAEATAAIQAAQAELWKLGVTGVHDFDRKRSFQALQALRQSGDLRLRVVKSIPLEDLPQAAAIGLGTGFGDDWLRIGSVKAFADGALGPQTAAMLQPYEGSPGNRGMLLIDSEELFEHGRVAAESGLSMAVHAIGDRANHEVLDAYSQLRRYESEQFPARPRLRHRIEHVQVIHPDDAARLAQLGVIASMQPIHATSDMLMADRLWGERAALSYAWRTQASYGAVLAFGSDAPVESPNPFWGLHAAVTRRRADGSPGPQGWRPEQSLGLKEALGGFTTGAAYAAGMEDRLGKLTPGYLADLIVLDRDPFAVEPDEIKDLLPSMVMVGGEWVIS